MQTTVKHLLPGDILVDSGFTVTRAPFVAGKPGKMCLQGHYPGRSESTHFCDASITVTIKRECAVPEPAIAGSQYNVPEGDKEEPLNIKFWLRNRGGICTGITMDEARALLVKAPNTVQSGKRGDGQRYDTWGWRHECGKPDSYIRFVSGVVTTYYGITPDIARVAMPTKIPQSEF